MEQDNTISAILITGLLFLAFSAIWMELEILCYGAVRQDIVDDIISIIVMYSFYCNVRNVLNRNNKGCHHEEKK